MQFYKAYLHTRTPTNNMQNEPRALKGSLSVKHQYCTMKVSLTRDTKKGPLRMSLLYLGHQQGTRSSYLRHHYPTWATNKVPDSPN